MSYRTGCLPGLLIHVAPWQFCFCPPALCGSRQRHRFRIKHTRHDAARIIGAVHVIGLRLNVGNYSLQLRLALYETLFQRLNVGDLRAQCADQLAEAGAMSPVQSVTYVSGMDT